MVYNLKSNFCVNCLRIMNIRNRNIEQSVGTRIRQRRTELGYTQQQLAQRVGLTYQQIHKYERGTNRISVARLVDLAEALEIEVAYFIADISAEQAPRPLTQQRLGLDMARNFSSISDANCREALARLCRAVARVSEG